MGFTWLYALLSVLVVSGVSLLGLVAIAVNGPRLQQAIFIMVSLAVGAMFGDTFIHLLPHVFTQPGGTLVPSMFVLAGILMFFLLEKFLLWRHEHIPHYGDCIQPVGYVNVVAEGLHNLIDGLLIGASYLVSPAVGLGTTLAVLLHEIPQEIGNFGVLLHAGMSPRKAVSWHLVCAALAVLGTVIALIVGAKVQGLPTVVLPLTAGGFIYLAGSDLVPELHKEREPIRSLIQMVAIGCGVGLMFLLVLLE